MPLQPANSTLFQVTNFHARSCDIQTLAKAPSWLNADIRSNNSTLKRKSICQWIAYTHWAGVVHKDELHTGRVWGQKIRQARLLIATLWKGNPNHSQAVPIRVYKWHRISSPMLSVAVDHCPFSLPGEVQNKPSLQQQSCRETYLLF